MNTSRHTVATVRSARTCGREATNETAISARVCRTCVFFVALHTGDAAAQPAKQQIVGTWSLVSIQYVEKDGRRIEPFGPGAKGMLYFDAGGRFATQVMAVNRPRFASNNRMTGTAEENKAMSQGVVAYFGTYTIDELNRVVTLHIEQSLFRNWNGTDQQRKFTFASDEFRYTAASSTANPAESAELVWKRTR
jgi:Lipocalin-like domain